MVPKRCDSSLKFWPGLGFLVQSAAGDSLARRSFPLGVFQLPGAASWPSLSAPCGAACGGSMNSLTVSGFTATHLLWDPGSSPGPQQPTAQILNAPAKAVQRSDFCSFQLNTGSSVHLQFILRVFSQGLVVSERRWTWMNPEAAALQERCSWLIPIREEWVDLATEEPDEDTSPTPPHLLLLIPGHPALPSNLAALLLAASPALSHVHQTQLFAHPHHKASLCLILKNLTLAPPCRSSHAYKIN